MNLYLDCPNCKEPLPIAESGEEVTCHECRQTSYVDRDGEFVNGSWSDRTQLFISRDRCPGNRFIDPRDPAYEREHAWVFTKAFDGTEFRVCVKCGKSEMDGAPSVG